MNRRTKWVLGVTVALMTVAGLRLTAGHYHWRQHRHAHGENHSSCDRSSWHRHSERSREKPQTESQPNP